jgi:hypothetical protein
VYVRLTLGPTALSVLRMVKMFGWEDKMSSRIFERRDEELVLLLKRKLFELAWGELKSDLPISLWI